MLWVVHRKYTTGHCPNENHRRQFRSRSADETNNLCRFSLNQQHSSGYEISMCFEQIFGSDIDFFSWDFGMTDGKVCTS